jgi:quinol-cytochrome oxidoreductase complex cytochrome b subunit
MEWYFLWVYALLPGIPNKLAGVAGVKLTESVAVAVAN